MASGYLHWLFLLLSVVFAALAALDWRENRGQLSIAGKTRARLALAFCVVGLVLGFIVR